MARYRLSQAAFIEPNLLPAGTIIEYSGAVGPHFEPLDDEGRAAIDAYYEKHPGASLDPTIGLSETVDGIKRTRTPGEKPEYSVLHNPSALNVPPQPNQFGFGDKAVPGPTDGGGILTPQLLAALAAAGIVPNQGSAARVTVDPEGIGSNAPTSTETLSPRPVNPPLGAPLAGDPSKPGEGGKEVADDKAAAAAANAASAKAGGDKAADKGDDKK